MNLSQLIPIIGEMAPWFIAAIAAASVTQFLKGLGTWEVQVPWQIRAFTRLIVLLMFIYLLTSGAIAFLPEGERITIFASNLDLIGDLLKTMIGAVIGALSMTLRVDSGIDPVDAKLDNLINQLPKPDGEK